MQMKKNCQQIIFLLLQKRSKKDLDDDYLFSHEIIMI